MLLYVVKIGFLLGMIMGSFQFQAEWMCGPTCAAPEDVSMTCDQCVNGIKASIDQLVKRKKAEQLT